MFDTKKGWQKISKSNSNSGNRNRAKTNRDRVRCYKYRAYDHFVNECPNSVMDDSNGCESDRAALQLITTDAEIHQNYEGTIPLKEQDYTNL